MKLPPLQYRRRHLCPACRRPVTRTQHHRIGGHLDKAGYPCPGSFEPFTITTVSIVKETP